MSLWSRSQQLAGTQGFSVSDYIRKFTKRDPPEDPSTSSHVTLCQETPLEQQRLELVKDTTQTPHDEKSPDRPSSPPPPPPAPQNASPSSITSPPESRPTTPPPPPPPATTSRPTSPLPESLSTPPPPLPPSTAASLPTPPTPPPPPEAVTSEPPEAVTSEPPQMVTSEAPSEGSLPPPPESSSVPPSVVAVLPLTRDGSVKASRKPKEVTLKSREPSKVQVFAPEPLSPSVVQKGDIQMTTVPAVERAPEAAAIRQDVAEVAEEIGKETEAPKPAVTAATIVEEPATSCTDMPEDTGQDEDLVFVGIEGPAEDISTQQTSQKTDSDHRDVERKTAGSEQDSTTENKEHVLVGKQDVVAPSGTVPENSLVGDAAQPVKPTVTPVRASAARKRSVDPGPEAALPVVDDCRAAPAPFEHRIVSAKQVPMGTYYSVKPNEVLGGGRFGQVHKCAELSSGLTLAAKIIKVKGMKEREEVKNEIAVMNQLNHVNLIQLYDAFECRSNLTLIMEFVEGGELFDRIVDESHQLTEMDAIVFMRQICEGVQYLHQQYILHLDLKPENILCVTSTGNQIKIIDFGLARKYRPREKLKVNFGTPEFLAPEVVNYDFVSFPTDMWSVGVITYMLLSGLSPFLGDNDAETMNNILHANWDFDAEAFENVSDEAKDFISRLLIGTRSGRLSASGCMKHSWLNNLPEKAKLHHVKLKSQVKLQRYLAAAHQWKKHFNVVAAANRLQRFCSQRRSTSVDTT